jgi:hypothetical protein
MFSWIIVTRMDCNSSKGQFTLASNVVVKSYFRNDIHICSTLIVDNLCVHVIRNLNIPLNILWYSINNRKLFKSIFKCRFLLFTTRFCDGNVTTSKPIYVKSISMLQLYGSKKKLHAIVEGRFVFLSRWQALKKNENKSAMQKLSQPYFEKMWGWNSHSQNGDLGVLWDSGNFRVQL